MERTQVLTLMGELKLYGMRLAYDEVMDLGIKRQHEPPHIVGDLLKAEIAEKQARSIRYQFKIAKLPLAKDIDDFTFDGTPINETLVRDLATGTFIANQRNAVLIGGTGTGKTHLAIATKHGSGMRQPQCTFLHQGWPEGPVLQCGRSGQSTGKRDTCRQAGPHCRLHDPP
jgi:DNA replication protein DnaC